MKIKFLLPLVALLSASSVQLHAQDEYYTPARSDTWVGVDALGRTFENDGSYRPKQKGKTVGMFYFIWQGSHGYDSHMNPPADGGVRPPSPADSISPYDISELLRENPEKPHYGPVHAFHHWAQPYLGYYVANDEWVIRKHAQMLSDAGVDVIFMDVTNASLYLPTVRTICEIYRRMRTEGNTTPDISFLLNTRPKETMQKLYTDFYKKGEYDDLWFTWKGKPLVLCPPEGITPEIADFFSVRQSWFASSWPWFGDGKDKWTWSDFYPQKAGWHESPDRPEALSVSAATHPTSNIGRSYHNGKQPDPADFKSGEGAFFIEQWGRALEVDPELVFVTGWNEWVAMRFTDGAAKHMLGKPIQKGDTYFVDQYDEEYSRDLEPMKGGFGDNYYYQLVDFVRRYKGMDPYPVHRRSGKMTIDGNMAKWKAIPSEYLDDKGDVASRDHFGWGRFKNYGNHTGRNDIVETKAACDGKNLYFYVRTDNMTTPHTEKNWMRLFIEVRGQGGQAWEGFQYVVNNKVASQSGTALQKYAGGWNWTDVATVTYRLSANEMELVVPLKELGIKGPFTVDFKWIDNAVENGDIMECIDNGDAAPNGRFKYRFVYKK